MAALSVTALLICTALGDAILMAITAGALLAAGVVLFRKELVSKAGAMMLVAGLMALAVAAMVGATLGAP